MNDDSKDIVERLRSTADTALPSTTGFTRLSDDAAQVLAEAAEEIERLREELSAEKPNGRMPGQGAAPTA
ncbi:hypothetical protein [Microvirga subterranea]|uniref:hypothetical protein n=1 Tax=Microvirga subterranea TaxID=186651 RepID=UPI0011C049DD|nr:hypothetical protein [Microvirga subterranea]